MSNLKIGEKIRAKRRERDLTQEELANILGVSKAAVSKWEKEESFPDITMLPQIAQLFHITMDELFDYTLEYKPPVVVNEYHFGLSLDDFDKCILNHGIAKECEVCQKREYLGGDVIEGEWEVRIHFVSTEENIPYLLQKHIRPGVLIDGYSIRIADGKAIVDDKPNKHYVCSEKVWEYNTKDIKYLREMLKAQVAMGLIKDDVAFLIRRLLLQKGHVAKKLTIFDTKTPLFIIAVFLYYSVIFLNQKFLLCKVYKKYTIIFHHGFVCYFLDYFLLF